MFLGGCVRVLDTEMPVCVCVCVCVCVWTCVPGLQEAHQSKMCVCVCVSNPCSHAAPCCPQPPTKFPWFKSKVGSVSLALVYSHQ